MKKTLLVLIAITIFSIPYLKAQNRFHPWAIGASYNVSNMEGLFNQKYFKARNYSGGIKLQVSRYLSPSFNARIEGTYGSIYYPVVKAYPQRVPGLFQQLNFFEASYLFEYKFNNNYVFKEDVYIQPYVFLGFGTNNMNKDWNTFFPWGAGLKIKCTKWMSINLETTYKVNIDNSYNYLQHNAGLIFSMGKAVKKYNKETTTNTKKVKDDLKDLEINNVIDSDKDGIIDAIDECPFIAGISSFKGCPDSDGDGVADTKDLCPNEKGSIENNGCLPKIIDSDEDGIADNMDKCPLVKGVASNNGCPIVNEEIVQNTNSTIETNNISNAIEIFYNVSNATLSNDQKVLLDKFATDWINKSYNKIKISGYTSNSGKDEINIKLSMDRAINIMNYLASKGLNQRLMSTYGYGSYNAKYSNSIPSESTKNQRVEIIVE